MPKTIPFPLSTLVATSLLCAVAATMLLAFGEPMAADADRGRLLYENHCMVCHTSVVHVREQRKAASREDLKAWIRRWEQQLDLQWGSSEVEDVIEYLNDRYYGFESES